MNLLSAFYYYLECSVIYVQQRIWGRFYNELLGFRIGNMSMAVLWMAFFLFMAKILHLSTNYAILLSALPVIPWLGYHFSNTYRKKGTEDKKQDFGHLPFLIRWVYISYSALLTIVAPIAIVGMLVYSWLR